MAEEKGKIVGFVHAEILSRSASRTDKKVLEIVDIYSSVKRRGIGNLLFGSVEKWAKLRDIDYILWEYTAGNDLARKFCLNNNFEDFKTKMLKKI